MCSEHTNLSKCTCTHGVTCTVAQCTQGHRSPVCVCSRFPNWKNWTSNFGINRFNSIYWFLFIALLAINVDRFFCKNGYRAIRRFFRFRWWLFDDVISSFFFLVSEINRFILMCVCSCVLCVCINIFLSIFIRYANMYELIIIIVSYIYCIGYGTIVLVCRYV